MPVHYLYAWHPQKPEEADGSPGTGITDTMCGWESNPELLDQPVILTTKSSP